MTGAAANPGAEVRADEKSVSLSERAYRLLRQTILAGDIPPDAKLKMDALQRQFEVSSSPLREALNRLLAEGLVLSDDHRGFRVSPISAADLRDITTFRLVVEPTALEESVRLGNDEWEADVMGAFHRLGRTHSRLTVGETRISDEWTTRHKAFHMALIAGCQSPRMIATCSNLFDQAERYRRFSASNRETPRDVAAEHHRLMEACLAHDAGTAARLLREHIQTTADNVLAHLARPMS